ncbi:hypothetical protein H8S10_01720 [Clostridium sp. NSJ-49]|jgi:uncharacterized membrane protein|uniref:Uncharacterized protein n=1 Tax=Clostridium disporicum TaxID=84024 RepID=A0A174EKN7_9CLOT|nr:MULTISPECIES: hypothetical protein [Clostridium]MBC5624176.1 hypothetical protein [Clostridium sp. NSJ-49]MCD2502582.1 hypothetical protein [Clostridium sp. NSJ-145]CUO36510.1 Uncharacterised protein [Clostridium disporicum]
MDDSNMLNDESLDKLGYIKELDIFSIVDKQFDKKRERKRVKRAIFISILIVVFVSLITCLAIIMPRIAVIDKRIMNIPKLIIGYYFVSVSMMMLLIIPIIKRKKSY